MNELTLVIPEKKESESIPIVLPELKKYKIKKIIVLESTDHETINSIKEEDCRIIHQNFKGYGNALIEGIAKVDTKYFCIFNADGSFRSDELSIMHEKL